MKTTIFTLFLFLAAITPSTAQEIPYPKDQPRVTPITRPAMKMMIEQMKDRQPRIPLPDLTDEDRKQLGEQADSYEARLRYHYLGQPGGRRKWTRQPDPASTLDNAFKIELFWIVSRVNNCQYCIGHQETKLLAAGSRESRIAALDCDWTQFKPNERAAFEFARTFTLDPHKLDDAAVERLQAHYSDLQILEMILSMSWNNSINRWKEAIGVPQSQHEGGYSRLLAQAETVSAELENLQHGSYLTDTPAEFRNARSVVAFYIDREPKQGFTKTQQPQRPELESSEVLEQMLDDCRGRQPRLPLVSQELARERLAEIMTNTDTADNWMRLLANFPVDGVRRAIDFWEVQHNDHLNPLMKARLAWIVARQDRALYMLGMARTQLKDLGQSQSDIYDLDGDWQQFDPADQSLFLLAKNLGASPVVLTDAEVDEAVRLAGPESVVQAINYVTGLAAMNRITEAAGLPLDQ